MLRNMFLAALALGSGVVAAATTAWIAPGAAWYDTDGNVIDAHGGGVVKRGDTFYWVGHSASNETPMMYSSTDLLNWKNLGKQAPSVTGFWRPKIAKPNGAFWLFGQQDRYSLSLKSASFVGGYAQSAKVHLPPNDYTYSDTGMFHDDATDTWYLLTSADHNIVQVNKINADGTLGAKVSDLRGGAYEAPGMFRANGVYFLVVSGKTGWRANPNKVFWATSPAGPWQGGSDIAAPDQKTYGSQNTFELVVNGTRQTTYVFMGDAWDSKGGAGSKYVWLPMAVDSGAKTVKLQYHAMWKIDVQTGEVSFPATKKRYEAADAELAGARRGPVERRAVHRVSGNETVTFSNVLGTGALQWVSVHYNVNQAELGEAWISVNGQPSIDVSSLNSRAGHHEVVPVRLVLRPGSSNILTFGVRGRKDFEANLSGIELFEDSMVG